MSFATRHEAICLDCYMESPTFVVQQALQHWKKDHTCRPCPFCEGPMFRPSEVCTEKAYHQPMRGLRPDGWRNGVARDGTRTGVAR